MRFPFVGGGDCLRGGIDSADRQAMLKAREWDESLWRRRRAGPLAVYEILRGRQPDEIPSRSVVLYLFELYLIRSVQASRARWGAVLRLR